MSTNSTVVSTTDDSSSSPSQAASATTTSSSTSSSTSTSTSTTPTSTSTSTTSSTSTSSSSPSPSTTTVTPTSTTDAVSTTTASSAPPSTTDLTTNVITETPAGSTSPTAVTVVSTITTGAGDHTTGTATTTSASSTTSSSSASSLSNSGSSSGSGGLSTGGKTAIAVVVPVVAVALIVLGLLYLWRKRKQKKQAEEARRKEVEDYGYNPNNQPTLPVVATDGHSEMAEDSSVGYRGWGAGKSSARNPSTTISNGHTQGQPSDSGSNNGGLSTSPTAFGSDTQSGEMYQQPHDTMTSDDLAALGAAPAATANRDMRRGPSNASSSYSMGHASDSSDQGLSHHNTYESGQGYAYGQHGPYGDGSYGGGDGMPVVRDVSARRNTRIEQGGTYQQGNSGIAQNF